MQKQKQKNMIVTVFNLLGANGKFKKVTYCGKYDEPFKFINQTEYSDFKLVGYDIIDLGSLKFTTPSENKYKEILSDISKDLDDYLNKTNIGIIDDVEWSNLFVERVSASIDSFEQ